MSTKPITSRNEEMITCEVDHSGGDDGGSGSPFVCLLLLLLLLRYFVAFTGLELTSSPG